VGVVNLQSRGSGDIGGSLGMTSHRLPTVTITVFAVLQVFHTDRRTGGIGLEKGGTMH